MTANASDGPRPRVAEAHDVAAIVRVLRDRFSVAQLRVAAILAGGAAGALTRAGVGRALPVRPGAWPSRARRIVSTWNVENVVSAPQKPVPMSRRQ